MTDTVGDHEFLVEYIRHHTAFLFHLTHVKNLPGIAAQRGLLSKERLSAAGVWPCPVPGGDADSQAVDWARGSWDLVSLAVTPQHPMFTKRRFDWGLDSVCLLRIDAEIAALPGVLFARSNALRSEVHLGAGVDGVGAIDFDTVARGWAGGAGKEQRQAEVLVPGMVHASAIREVVFGSRDAADLVDGHIRSMGPSVRMLWDREAFFAIPRPVQRPPPTTRDAAPPPSRLATPHVEVPTPLRPLAIGRPRTTKKRRECEYCGGVIAKGWEMVMARMRGDGEPSYEAYVHVSCATI